jgi:hypothetical protein
MTSLTLTWIKRETRQGQKGPFESVSIKATEYGPSYLSGYGDENNKNWKVGDTVEVESVETVKKGDKEYLNFKMPRSSKGGASQADLNSIKGTLVNLTVQLTTVETLVRKLGRLYEQKEGVIVTKDAIIPKSVEEVAQEEFDALDYPENNLGEIDFDPKE